MCQTAQHLLQFQETTFLKHAEQWKSLGWIPAPAEDLLTTQKTCPGPSAISLSIWTPRKLLTPKAPEAFYFGFRCCRTSLGEQKCGRELHVQKQTQKRGTWMTRLVLRVSSHGIRIAKTIVISLPILQCHFRPGGVAWKKKHHYFMGSMASMCGPSEKTIHEKLI